MDQLTPLLLLGAAYGLVTAIGFQLWKPFPDYWLFAGARAAHPLHDPTMRLLLFATAAVIVLLSTLAGLHPHQILDMTGAWTVLKTAAGAWIVALTTYHALNGDILGSLTVGGGGVVVQAPPAQPAEPTAVVVPPASKPTVVVQPPAPALPPPAGDTAPTPPETPPAG